MSRLCVAVVLALCAVHIDAQVLGYISQSFSLIRSDTLENADYTLVNNITARDGLVSGFNPISFQLNELNSK